MHISPIYSRFSLGSPNINLTLQPCPQFPQGRAGTTASRPSPLRKMHPSVLKPSGGAVGAILLASTIAARETQSVTDVWQLAPAPASLDASIIEARSTTIDSVSRYVATYEVDCPASSSPDNDGCRDLRIYPARIYHTQGSIYGGTWSSHPDNGITTTWRCELGDCGSLCAAFRAQTADCLLTIQYSQATYQILTTKVESCQVAQNSVPLAITRGIQRLDPDRSHATYDVPQYISSVNDHLSNIGCQPKPTLQETFFSFPFRASPGTIAPSTSTTIPISTPTSALTTTPATGPVASQDQAAATSQSRSSTPSSDADGWVSRRLGCGLVALCLALGLSIS